MQLLLSDPRADASANDNAALRVAHPLEINMLAQSPSVLHTWAARGAACEPPSWDKTSVLKAAWRSAWPRRFAAVGARLYVP